MLSQGQLAHELTMELIKGKNFSSESEIVKAYIDIHDNVIAALTNLNPAEL